MNKNFITGLVVVVIVLLVGLVFYISSNNSKNSIVVGEDAATGDESMVDEDSAMGESRYVVYTPEKFETAKDKKRVYFFHASWCPTCKVLNEEINSNLNLIPEDVVLFKTDYDTESALKQKYGITYQHTFVQVDENGNEITQWNGGGLDELVANVR